MEVMAALFLVLGIVGLAVAAVVYMLPSIVAARRNHHQSPAICILNVFLGWTLLGWAAALVWACTATPGRSPLSPVAAATEERKIHC
jgi:hypothetical protein